MPHERGEVTTAVLLVPLAMGLILLVVQAAMVFHGQAIIDAAAQDGALAGQGELGTEATAQTTARSVIGKSAGNLLSDIEVFVEAEQSMLSVRVQAAVKSLLPGYSPTISSIATGPREIFIPESRR